MRENPKPQEIYKHFKGNLYQIMSLAKDSETGETLVVYQALYGDFSWYVRPLNMFMSEVDRNKYPNAEQKYRFENVVGLVKENEQIETMAENKNVDEMEIVPLGQKTLEEGGELDPLVLEFLDAESYEQKLNILTALHHRITDQMITTMAIASDIEIGKGDVEQRFMELKQCLMTKDRFEIKRY